MPTPEEIIDLCVLAARNGLGTENTVFGVVKSSDEFLEYTEENRSLTIIENATQIRNYVATYSRYFKQHNRQEPTEVIFKDCIFRYSGLEEPYIKLKLEKCKLLCNSSFIVVSEIFDCELAFPRAMEIRNINILRNSLIRGPVQINDVSQVGLVTVSKNIFLSSLTANFVSKIIINHSKIKELQHNGADCIINKSHIETANFNPPTNKLTISNSTFDHITFTNVAFARALFMNATFVTSPVIQNNTEFKSKNVYFQGTKFLDRNSGDAIGTFRQLKKMCEDAGYEHGVIEFHALELETHYNLYLKGKWPKGMWPEKIGSWLHRKFTDYGRNVSLPFIYLFAFFVLGSVFNAFNEWMNTHYFDNEHIKNALLFSFRNSIGPLFFALPKDIREMSLDSNLVDVFAFIQISFCSVIWFLIVFMIRRRFKL